MGKEQGNKKRSKEDSKTKGNTVPWLRRFVTGLSPRKPGSAAWSVHVGFVVDKVALGQVSL
jgi:hypothetical protein